MWFFDMATLLSIGICGAHFKELDFNTFPKHECEADLGDTNADLTEDILSGLALFYYNSSIENPCALEVRSLIQQNKLSKVSHFNCTEHLLNATLSLFINVDRNKWIDSCFIVAASLFSQHAAPQVETEAMEAIKNRTSKIMEGLTEAMTNCISPPKQHRSKRSLASPVEDPKQFADDIMGLIGPLIDMSPFSVVFAPFLKSGLSFIPGNEANDLKNIIATNHKLMMKKLSRIQSKIEGLPNFIKAQSKIKQYREFRHQISKLNEQFEKYITSGKPRSVAVRDEFLKYCFPFGQSETMSLLLSIRSLFRDTSDMFGNFIPALVSASNRDRSAFSIVTYEIQADVCKLSYLHGVCSALGSRHADVLADDERLFSSTMHDVIQKLKVFDLDLATSYRADSRVYLNEIVNEKNEYDAVLLRELLQLKYYWLNVTVVTYNRDKDDVRSFEWHNDNCTTVLEGATYNIVVYFNDLGFSGELQSHLQQSADLLQGNKDVFITRSFYIRQGKKVWGKWKRRDCDTFNAEHFRSEFWFVHFEPMQDAIIVQFRDWISRPTYASCASGTNAQGLLALPTSSSFPEWASMERISRVLRWELVLHTKCPLYNDATMSE